MSEEIAALNLMDADEAEALEGAPPEVPTVELRYDHARTIADYLHAVRGEPQPDPDHVASLDEAHAALSVAAGHPFVPVEERGGFNEDKKQYGKPKGDPPADLRAFAEGLGVQFDFVQTEEEGEA